MQPEAYKVSEAIKSRLIILKQKIDLTSVSGHLPFELSEEFWVIDDIFGNCDKNLLKLFWKFFGYSTVFMGFLLKWFSIKTKVSHLISKVVILNESEKC